MAELKSETARPLRESAGQERGRFRRLGRRIATAIVWASLLYVTGVGLVSVIPQAFWPEGAELDPAISCRAGLIALEDEMLAYAGDHVRRGGTADDAAHEAFFERWDGRHRALEARCQDDEHDAWVQIARMRERLSITLSRFDTEEGELAREIDSTLAHHGR